MILLLARHHQRLQQALHAPPLWLAAIGCLIAAILLCGAHALWKKARGTSGQGRRAAPAFYPPQPQPRSRRSGRR